MNKAKKHINLVLDCRAQRSWGLTCFDDGSQLIVTEEDLTYDDSSSLQKAIAEERISEAIAFLQDRVNPHVLAGVVLISHNYNLPASPSVLCSYPVPVVCIPSYVAIANLTIPTISRSLLIDSSSTGRLILSQRNPEGSIVSFGEGTSLHRILNKTESKDDYYFDDVLLHHIISAGNLEKLLVEQDMNALRNLEASFLHDRGYYKKLLETNLKELLGIIISLNYAAAFDGILCTGIFFDIFFDLVREMLRESLLKNRSSLLKEGFMIKPIKTLEMRIGALNYAHEIIGGPGVWATEDVKSRIFNFKTPPETIAYKVIHPSQPVFDLQDNSIVEFSAAKPILAAIDEKVLGIYGGDILNYLNKRTNLIGHIELKGDEPHKTWDQVQKVCSVAIGSGLRRDGIILAIGGGVVLDVVGFAASIFRRGVPYLRIPTTLVGMIDVGVGIKQGINFDGRKNILGSFYPAIGSINDSNFLKTLDKIEIVYGLAEIIKMGIICDETLFGIVEKFGSSLVDNKFQEPKETALEVMLRAEQSMMAELQPNLREMNLQRLVDFGHTFSPTIEAESNYAIPHGLAVGIDMFYCTFIAVQRRICSKETLKRLMDLYNLIGLGFSQNVATAKHLFSALDSIKAHRGGALNLVVPKGIGVADFIQDVDYAEIQQALAFSNSLRR